MDAVPTLSVGISRPTDLAAYVRFTPSKSGQRSPLTSYRSCWHAIGWGFLVGYRQFRRSGPSSPTTGLYTPKSFIAHAASLRQAFAHCAIFPDANSLWSLDHVSVPVRPAVLSDRLPVIALVGRYLTNKLIGRRPISRRPPKRTFLQQAAARCSVSRISRPKSLVPVREAGYLRVTRPFAARVGAKTWASPRFGSPSHDSHSLGTPQAFVLSQDQTLHQKATLGAKEPRTVDPNCRQALRPELGYSSPSDARHSIVKVRWYSTSKGRGLPR